MNTYLSYWGERKDFIVKLSCRSRADIHTNISFKLALYKRLRNTVLFIQ